MKDVISNNIALGIDTNLEARAKAPLATVSIYLPFVNLRGPSA